MDTSPHWGPESYPTALRHHSYSLVNANGALFYGNGDQAQGLARAKQELHHLATFVSSSFPSLLLHSPIPCLPPSLSSFSFLFLIVRVPYPSWSQIQYVTEMETESCLHLPTAGIADVSYRPWMRSAGFKPRAYYMLGSHSDN